MRVISITREFGSGGRELGKRLADSLHFDYYDKEIIAMISDKHQLNPQYIEAVLEKGIWNNTPLVIGSSFTMPHLSNELLACQTDIINEIAALGRDCVIVGRGADSVLAEYNPLKLFVYADLPSKLKRCTEHAKEGENLSEKQLINKIKTIDEGRIRTKEIVTGHKWDAKEHYNLMINTSSCSIKSIIPSLTSFALDWFESKEK